MTTPALPLYPSDEQVAVSWLSTVPGLSYSMVATNLPADVDASNNPAAWTKTGFVTVAVVGGNPDPLLPVNRPVMQVDVYATVPGSNKPPWGQSAAIASAIRRACWSRTFIPRPLQIVANGVTYPTAVVQGARLATAFRRMYSDSADYARLQGDLWLSWVTVNDRID
jgi:hypothetical protein